MFLIVDDGMVIGNRQQSIEGFKAVLLERFKIQSYLLELFVGIAIVAAII